MKVMLNNNENSGNNDNNDVEKTKPVLTWDNMTDNEVHWRTGFGNLKLMLSVASVMSGGDFEKMTQTISKLAWLDEWVLYFEFFWHRSMRRWPDYAEAYKCRVKTVRDIV